MQFHILSFEGPDTYSRVGGLETRVTGLAKALADMEFEAHLWFVGDPNLPGHESHENLFLHRWCQWLSRYSPRGVYDGEKAKADDYSSSLPPFLLNEQLLPKLVKNDRATIIAEEWQTVNAILHLDWLLRNANLRNQVSIFWNANNTYGFEQIDWTKLQQAATITTVSRYMKHRMASFGIDALVIPNGLSPDAFEPPNRTGVNQLQRILKNRMVVTKLARFSPDKRWITSVDIIGRLKQQGRRPLFIARGGNEPYGKEVMSIARKLGLKVVDRDNGRGELDGLFRALDNTDDADVINLQAHVDPDTRRVLFRAADTVLANSSHEPFGLVGLEAMAVGGIACTGCSGEDYAVAGRNALVLQTGEAQEFMGLYEQLHSTPGQIPAMRRAGKSTAKQYAWPEVIRSNLLPRIVLTQDE
jgi:glycosyltransferase involved in cell wall biosynthesis